MSPEELSAIAGVLLSLAMSYVPGLREWYAGQSSEYKRLIMLAALAVAALGAWGLGCAGLYQVACDQQGALIVARAFFSAAVANQAAYLLSPPVKLRHDKIG